ncbi:glutathione-dependent formaldehyde dehydrogenase [Pilimelia terevasa]|uniref:Glutathione-dependent formaldehyde dehydrogenase n=1 Tax=Pilimelia terevasa TaxID=53372 RepID=A0A8J3FHM5_9ACTN|nr:zinc-dependent alcohol dehydrogenase [Pilimelia terevasa]GGK21854.1 glutathione-dependent formaldehyde dehydrogenase [Pilimelia terevasa]
MRAVTWHGKRDVRVDTVPDPLIKEPTDAVIRITSTGICGSDLHLYEVLGTFMTEGDILGHEPMGEVVEVGAAVHQLKIGDRVVIPFQIACGHCLMCRGGLQTQCETTQVREQGMGAALYGYTRLYGQVAGGQAEYLRVLHADYNPITIPAEGPDDRYVYLSDVLPTAWQAVEYAGVRPGGSLAVIGLGPIGDMAARIAAYQGIDVIGVDLVPERLARVRALGIDVINLTANDDVAAVLRDRTQGRGPDGVIDAVGMEAHGSPASALAQTVTGLLPDAMAEPLMRRVGVDRMSALLLAIDAVRRGGTVSIVGVYGGQTDPLPMLTLFDKQVTLRMGQANVRRWVPSILPLLTDDDPLGVDTFATHRIPLGDAPQAYADFQAKSDGVVKVLLRP